MELYEWPGSVSGVADPGSHIKSGSDPEKKIEPRSKTQEKLYMHPDPSKPLIWIRLKKLTNIFSFFFQYLILKIIKNKDIFS